MLCACGGRPGAPDSDTAELVGDVRDDLDSAEVVADLPRETADAQPDAAPADVQPEEVTCDGLLQCPQKLASFCENEDNPAETAEQVSISDYIPGEAVYTLDPAGLGGYWMAGDIEASCFDPEHPFILRRIMVYVTGAGQAEIHLWADFGGSWPDQDKDLVPPFIVEVPEEGWMELDIDGEGIELAPYERVWVGLVHDDSEMCLGADEGDPFLQSEDTPTWALTNHSKLRSQWYVEQMKSQGGFQWISSPFTYLISLEGEYICRHDVRGFFDASDQAFGAEVYGTRVSWSDIDGDGLDDFMVHNHRHAGEPKQRLFRNEGNGAFQEWSGDAGLVGRGSNFVTFADVDNDGDQDALLSVYYNLENNPDPAWEDALMVNDGTGHFEENVDSGVENGSTTATLAFADYDGDGWLDHLAGNTRHHGPDKPYDQAMKDMLFHGDGDGTFSEVTDEAGMTDQPSSYYPLNPEYFTLTNGVLWTDYDNDGDQDLYVANYGLCGNFMWENQGDGTFLEVGEARNLAGDDRDGLFAEGTSFGVHWADYDNDGDMDMFQTEISHPRYHELGSDRSSLRRNPGGPAPVFEIVTEAAGIIWDEGDYEVSFVDYDNDGLQDVYISSTYGLHYSRLYRQRPDHTFKDWTYRAGVRWMNAKSHAWADYDRDGDQDLFVCSRQPGWPCRLFRNDVGQDAGWLTVRTVGTKDNSDGIGARVELQVPGWPTLTREVRAGGGHTRQDSLPVEFGVGSSDGEVTLTVVWPDGSSDSHEGVKLRSFIVVTQGSPELLYE